MRYENIVPHIEKKNTIEGDKMQCFFHFFPRTLSQSAMPFFLFAIHCQPYYLCVCVKYLQIVSSDITYKT